MSKSYCSLGLMRGTSGDGVDASIIQSDGDTTYKVILDKYYKYNKDIHKSIHNLKDKINDLNDLKYLEKTINEVEKQITIFHVKIINEITKNYKKKIDLIGFHGQTIFHSPKQKISKQLGDGKLLSELTKKITVYNFRKNDLKNNGQGAPLTPIFHKILVKENNIDLPVCILNLGGIANITLIKDDDYKNLISYDIGPGNCLIDSWIRKNSENEYDLDGLIAKSGKINKKVLEDAIQNFNKEKKLSFDTKDFNLSFVANLSLEDGAATLTEYTGRVLGEAILSLAKLENKKLFKVLICGGGRKNKILLKSIENGTSKKITFQPIDIYGINGDFVESQAFAYLAIRSYLKKPITFPSTTGCSKPTLGGDIIEN